MKQISTNDMIIVVGGYRAVGGGWRYNGNPRGGFGDSYFDVIARGSNGRIQF